MAQAPKKPKRAKKHPSLPSKALRWYADPALFDFPSTAFIEPLNGIIGQRRALEALTLGAQINSPGYNIFVSGLSGTGRLTTIKNILEHMSPDVRVLHDYAYVNNFDDPDAPRLLKFPNGRAVLFRDAMYDAIHYLKVQIAKMFDDENFRAGRMKIIDDFQDREQNMLREFEERIRPEGFALGQRKTNADVVQPEILPIIDDKPYNIGALDDLIKEGRIDVEEAKKIGENYKRLQAELFGLAKHGMKLTQEFQKELAKYERESTRILVDATLDDIRGKFPFEAVLDHLKCVREDILDNLDLFKKHGNDQSDPGKGKDNPEADPFSKYYVNVVLDNSETTSSPVIIETTPTFVNLFGTIEKVYDQRGYWTTDFMRIKAGSILKADGGFLIINAVDALSESGVWKALKRVLLHRKLEIQSIESFFQTSSSQASALKPQGIDLNVKVIMIGDVRLYHSLFNGEEDFRKIFKINAEFDYEIDRSDAILTEYARFIRRISDEEHLLHFDREGVATVLEYAVEKAGNVNKISLRFSDVADLLREASFWAEKDSAEVVTRYHVKKAHATMLDRNSTWKDKVMERILEGTLMIATEGKRVGQINGLAVYSMGQASFGKPTRLTATVAVGGQGIVNIEREARLSGSVFNKGAMILIGFLRNRFAQKRPLSLAASVVFEQSYGGIEGDSASSTEVYALFSALSRIPIRQDMAVTGSVNQWGEIQPIGGVKEKIEGFFDVCKARGLTGSQGVLIPIQNVTELMLRDDVVETVESGLFHVYAVSTIDQGIEILTGVAAGERDESGSYPDGTINGLVEHRLIELADNLKNSMSLVANGNANVIHMDLPAMPESEDGMPEAPL